MTASLHLQPVTGRTSVRSQVINALRAALVTGQLTPGHTYSAPTLATQFGVSATPVREAMLELVKEGLVVAVPNKGFRVRELSDRELDEITEIRLLLEVPTTVKAVELASAERLARLRPVAQRIVSAARDTDLISYIEHDRQFHQALLGLAGNELLVSMVSELRSRSRLYGLRQLADRGELVASGAEHVAMLDLIEAGDRAGLERLMRKHIGHVRGSWAGRSEGGTENTRNEEASR
ncbi:MAG TPA: GntR family transcriptional regulator [Pseudonocardiaceae bacterium]